MARSHAPEEHRRFVAEFANGIWYGDVMHGPTLTVQGQRRKVYLVSLMDDASRLIAHSAFCLGETALDIEGVLKQAVLKRGLPTETGGGQRRRLSRRHPAGHLRPAGHPADLLPALCAGGQG